MQEATLDEDDFDTEVCDDEDDNDETESVDENEDDHEDKSDEDEDDESDEESGKKITSPVCTVNLTRCRAFQFSTQYFASALQYNHGPKLGCSRLLEVGNFLEILGGIWQKLKF